MDPFALTRSLIDIESVTGRELAVGEFLFSTLEELALKSGGRTERMYVEPYRFNVLATWGTPLVVMSTHMDTVPPFFRSSEDAEFVRGRGACDAKGIAAAMICAAKELCAAGTTNFALLFVVGEEKDSLGALTAARQPRGVKFLINGEPTENQLALGSKGSLRYLVTARGRLAHSAYPELGESAILKLLDALEAVRKLPLPVDKLLGRSTLNIGTISGGHAPNVIADEARADLMFRTVGDPAPIRAALRTAVDGRVEMEEVLHTPALHLEAVPGFRTTVVAYTTDIPNFGGAWGKPLLIGPGTIHVAHTAEERISKKELLEAIAIYARLVERLLGGVG
ncbi:MAG TPA: M20/M25/M40 family metallo-hydrolase [Candidatus Acidoferrum sp.]|nr:M20/M25/M40 family metallo-hydrolase [Candidatus Acidoferrum sp.]